MEEYTIEYLQGIREGLMIAKYYMWTKDVIQTVDSMIEEIDIRIDLYGDRMEQSCGK